MSANKNIVTLYSPFSPVEIAYKMRDLIGEGTAAKSVNGLIGNGNEQYFSLYFEDQPDVMQFKAQLEPDDSGTVIKGEYQGALLTHDERKVMVGCFGLFALIFLIVAAVGIYRQTYFEVFGGILGAIIVALIGRKTLLDPKSRSRVPGGRQKILVFLEQHLHIVAYPKA